MRLSGSGWIGWIRFVLIRLGSAAVTMLGITTITFVVVRLVGNPVYLLVGQQSSPEIISALSKSMGLDKPIWQQYLGYLWSAAHGDFGISRATYRPVSGEILFRLPATFELVAAAMLIAAAVSIPLGLGAGARPGQIADRLSQFVVQAGVSLPAFWVGLILIYLFFAVLPILPAPLGQLDSAVTAPPRVTGLVTVDSLLAGDADAFGSAVRHLLLPAMTLALVAIPATLQITRTTLIQVFTSDYIRTARSFGLSRRTISLRYGLKNALVPILTVLAMTFGYLMSSTVLVEVIFSWPGIGLYAVTAMNQFDYEPIVGVVIVAAAAYIVAYLVADLLSAAIDPRIRT
jgi:peptide/nickel transport system permease protein